MKSYLTKRGKHVPLCGYGEREVKSWGKRETSEYPSHTHFLTREFAGRLPFLVSKTWKWMSDCGSSFKVINEAIGLKYTQVHLDGSVG